MAHSYIHIPVIETDTMFTSSGSNSISEFTVKHEAHEIPGELTVYREYSPIKMATNFRCRYYYQDKVHTKLLMVESFSLADPELNSEIVIDTFVDELSNDYPGIHPKVLELFRERVAFAFADTLEVGGPAASSEQESDGLPAWESIQKASKELPGITTLVKSPCDCKRKYDHFTLWSLIQHLNDEHKEWTREKIADWLDELHDSGEVNIEFEPWKEEDEQDTREG